MIRRSTLKPVAQPVQAERPRKFRCGSCGVTIPQMARRPYICSYCAGRPGWGGCKLFEEMIADEIRLLEADYGKPFSTVNRNNWWAFLSNRSAWESEPFNKRRRI